MKTKGTLRRVLSLFLALVLALSTVSTAFARADDRPKLNLVSFGDSMTNGYGHDGYYEGSTQVNGFLQNDVTTTYPYYLEKYLRESYTDRNVVWTALAVSCMRTEDVNFLLRYHTADDAWNDLAKKLDSSEEGTFGSSTVENWKDNGAKYAWDSTFIDDGNVIGDYFTWNEFVQGRFWDWKNAGGTGFFDTNPTRAYAGVYQNAVENADVITLGTGNANFGVIMLQNITSYLTGTFGSGFKDAVPVREVLQRRLPAEILPQAYDILDKIDALVVPKLGTLGEEKAAKVLEIVEHTTVSFMFSYMDMLYAIDELNDKDNLDVIMMGLMNTMDGVKIDTGNGDILDLGAVVDAITDVLSAYYFVLPVALQELKGDFENITFYIVPNDDHIEMQVSDMASLEKIKQSNTIRERMIQEVSGMIFNLVRQPLNGALSGTGFEFPTWSMNDNTAKQYREKVEAYEQLQADYKAWVDGGHKGLFNIAATKEGSSELKYGALFTSNQFNANDALACAVYLAFEQAIIANADNATLDLAGLMSLMGGTAGLAGMMTPIAGALTDSFGTEAQEELEGKVAASVAAQLVAAGKAQYNTEAITTAIEGWITEVTNIISQLQNLSQDTTDADALKIALEAIKDQAIVPAGGWYNLSFTGGNAQANMPYVGDALRTFADSMNAEKDGNVVAAPTAMFTAIELTNALNGALGTALTSDDAASLGGLLSLYARMIIGNGIGSHPTAVGHHTLFEEIMEVYPDKPAKEFFEEVVKDTAEELYQLAKSGNTEALNKIVALALEQGLIDAAQAELIKAQLPKIYVAVYEQNDEAILNSCEKLAALLYDCAVANGKVPEEVQKVVNEFFRIYNDMKDLTQEQQKAYVETMLKGLAEEYGSEALNKLNNYVLSLKVLNAQQLAELETKIWDFINAYPDAPDATLDAAIDELVDFLFEVTKLDKDKVVAMYHYLTTTSREQMIQDATALMQKYLDKYGPKALEYIENYLIEEGYVTADEIAEITKQVKLAIAAYEAQDEAAMKASCEKLAKLIYAYVDAKGYIPAEVKEALAKAMELYNEYGDMTPEQIKALAVAELQKFAAEHKAEALIALHTFITDQGWCDDINAAKALAEKIAAAIAAYEADPEGIAKKMVAELVDYLYDLAVAEGYIDPAKVAELNKLADMVKCACDYFANTSEEQMKADAIALLFAELDKLTDGKVNAEVYAQVKADIAKLIVKLDELSKATPAVARNCVMQYINSVKEAYDALIDDATHGEYVSNGVSYYVALGGDTVYGTGIGKYDNGYYDLLLEELELNAKTQYKNLGEQNIDLTKLLAYIEKNADAIKKADLITYQMDATAFILAALNEEDPDWSRYFTEEELAFVEEALPVIQKILEDDWTKYADIDVEELTDELAKQVFAAISKPVMKMFKHQDDKLQQLFEICVAQVKSYVAFAQEQAKEVAEYVVKGDVAVNKAFELVKEKLAENWADYVGQEANAIVDDVMAKVEAQLDECSDEAYAKLKEFVTACAKEIAALHEHVAEKLNAVPAQLSEYFNEDELAAAEAVYDLVVSYIPQEYTNIDAEVIHQQVYAYIVAKAAEGDAALESFLDCGEEFVNDVLTRCVNLAVEAASAAQSQTKDAVAALEEAYGKLEDMVLPVVKNVLADNWTQYVDMVSDEIVSEIQSAVLTELAKQGEAAQTYVDQYTNELNAVLTVCVDEVKSVLVTAQAKKDEVNTVLDKLEPFKPYIEKLLYASVAFAVDTAKAVDAIQEIDPDATLIVVGMYNPLDGLEIVMNGETIDVGAYMEYLIDATNVYYTALAVADGGFTFVAVPDTTINGFKNAIDVDALDISKLGSMLLKLNDSMYANAAGHQYIYEQIMGALDTEPKVDNKTKETTADFDAKVSFEDNNKTAVVECDKACVVLARLADGSYVRLNAVKRANDSYEFDLSGVEGQFTLTVALKGDYNLDGTVTTNDVARANKALVNHTDPSELQNYVFDMTGDDAITTNDVAKANKSIVNKTAIDW